MTFGVTTKKWDTAEELMNGWPEDAAKPDASIGKSLKPGLRNTLDGTRIDGKAFGVPSIRTDLKPVKRDAISRIGTRDSASEQVGARVFPRNRGRNEEDWHKPRTKEEVSE